MKVSIIGYGEMGAMLSNAMVKRDKDVKINIYNRSRISPSPITTYSNITLSDDLIKTVGKADIIFLCVPPKACLEVLEKIQTFIPDRSILVSIANDLEMESIKLLFRGKIVRFMPTILSKVESGTTLLAYNSLVEPGDIDSIKKLFPDTFSFETIPESDFDTFSGITSCGPGLISAILSSYIGALAEKTGAESEMCRRLITETAYGTLLLSQRTNKSFDDILNEVATEGGITGTGAGVLNKELPALFNKMLEKMSSRHKERKDEVRLKVEY